MLVCLPRNLFKRDMLPRTARARGVSIGLQQPRKMSSSAALEWPSMQNGISESKSDTVRIRRADTNSLIAISRMFTAAECTQRDPEHANTAQQKLDKKQASWLASVKQALGASVEIVAIDY